ncbi:hypothetical protein O181_095128, partial [Austropuccinia psidii MF-1]|nr:hypothetical protein [Austropuccinia psidii MF-1]
GDHRDSVSGNFEKPHAVTPRMALYDFHLEIPLSLLHQLVRLNFWRTKALLAIRKGQSSPNTVIFSTRFRSAIRPGLTFGQLFVMS